jgi:hypothetical protein
MIAADDRQAFWAQSNRSPDMPIFLEASAPSMGWREPAMSAIPVMLIVWAAIAACFLGLLAYRGQLTRYEEDQLFLNDNVTHEQQEQTEIIRKVNKIQPLVRIFGVAAAAMTAGIVGIFTYDAWQHLK